MAYLAEIPYGAYWSTPFAKWQGSFANLHSVEFAAHVAKAELAKRRIAPEAFDYGVLGMTVPQKASFYGLAVVHGTDRRPQSRRADHQPRPAPPACAACSPVPRKSKRDLPQPR